MATPIRKPTTGTTTFQGFESPQRLIIEDDLRYAVDLIVECVNALRYEPPSTPLMTGGIYPKVPKQQEMQQAKLEKLLQDTFDIGRDDRDRVGIILDRFREFPTRMQRITFIYSDEYRGDETHITYGAWVKEQETGSVYISDNYFKLLDPSAEKKRRLERSVTLIHEYIHLIFPGEGHPGGVFQSDDRAKIGVPFDEAIKNAYCYEYFAYWLRKPEGEGGMRVKAFSQEQEN